MPREFNFIYEKLVTKDSDFVGMLAYSIYKKQKVKWCKEFHKKNGKNPTNEDLKSFHDTVSTDIEGYRERAVKLNENYQKILFKRKSDEILNLYREHIPDKKSYWHGVGQNILSSFIYSAILIVVVWLINNQVDLVDLFINTT